MEPENVTQLLADAQRGVPDAGRRLIDAVHSALRTMAALKMDAERPGHTLQPTALVNEAWLRLLGSEGRLEDRAHFFGAAAKAMERVLVDHARKKRALKRDGKGDRVSLHDLEVASPIGDFDVFAIHDAVEALEQERPDLAALVRYRYFVGLTLEQIVEIEGSSLATLKRRWTFARAWLYERLGD